MTRQDFALASRGLRADFVSEMTSVARKDINRLDEALDDARSHAGVALVDGDNAADEA
ncbi:hypothetical protein HY631_04385 [Candidatus Uhrbacteria bacterium]|nr:hypothetical protein [Candidatus Uhrbacteria bacterium]